VPATKVEPGAEVVYVLSYKNTGKAPAEKVVISNPVPANLEFREASTAAGAAADVSVDGGKTWGRLAALKVTGKDNKPRAAQASDVTDVRWVLAAAVPAGGEGKVTYRARLK
jgi:uncharacterized repeat protein (TIGR01451 family)